MSETVFRVGPKDRGKRLDRFLQERIPALSRTWVQRAISRRVRVSWSVRVRPSTRVRAGGEVRVGFPPLRETPLDLKLEVLARGPGWLAVDKPAGIPVHPVNRVRANSLIRLLRRQEGDDGLRLVHRLDRETSGVLVVAGDPSTARALSTAFERGEVRKEYVAVVAGEVAGEAGTVTFPIGPSTDSEIRVRLAPSKAGKPAQTSWRVEQRLKGRTVLRVFPRTGRRHQIRVHLLALGHPILGDLLYGRDDADYLGLVRGDGDVRRDEDGPRRQLLHCARLVLPDPAGGPEIDVAAALAADVLVEIEGRSRVL
jgi:RluA family pseudouridine synthase